MNELKWAVLGTGVIANEMAQALHNMGRTLYGVCNRTYDKAVSFAKKYHVEKVYTSYNEMYEDSSVDVIYITTPHNTHYEFIRQSLLHGKHVLAEKSITLNSSELNKLKALADEKGLVLAEAMTIWHMPLYKKLWQIVESGQIGRPQMITMNFGVSALPVLSAAWATKDHKTSRVTIESVLRLTLLIGLPAGIGWRRYAGYRCVCIEYCPKFYV